jgi:hypothetical protein
MNPSFHRLLAVACLLAPLTCEAQPASKGPAQGNSAPLIVIEVESSRPKLVAGEGIGIVGTIQNTSQSTVYVRELSLTMTLPVELEGSRDEVYGYPAYFPTEPHDSGKPYAEYFGNVVAIKPGDRYAAYWTSTSMRSKTQSSSAYVFQQVTAQLQYLFFYPGEYKILVAAKYWTDPKLPADGYRTVTRSATVSVGAPLVVILIGAALGGLVAYIILPKRALEPSRILPAWADSLFRHSVGVSGAVLLSVIVTIMLSRIAETQFIISVTVNDVWGAIVIGFVAQYGGMKLLEKLVPGKGTEPTGPQQQVGTPGPPTPP